MNSNCFAIFFSSFLVMSVQIICIFYDVKLLHVLFHYLTPGLLWPTYWPSTFHLHLLSMLLSSLCFTWPNHLNLVFLNLCSRFSTPHLLLTSSLVILSCHLTLDMYLNILYSIYKKKQCDMKEKELKNEKIIPQEGLDSKPSMAN